MKSSNVWFWLSLIVAIAIAVFVVRYFLVMLKFLN